MEGHNEATRRDCWPINSKCLNSFKPFKQCLEISNKYFNNFKAYKRCWTISSDYSTIKTNYSKSCNSSRQFWIVLVSLYFICLLRGFWLSHLWWNAAVNMVNIPDKLFFIRDNVGKCTFILTIFHSGVYAVTQMRLKTGNTYPSFHQLHESLCTSRTQTIGWRWGNNLGNLWLSVLWICFLYCPVSHYGEHCTLCTVKTTWLMWYYLCQIFIFNCEK